MVGLMRRLSGRLTFPAGKAVKTRSAGSKSVFACCYFSDFLTEHTGSSNRSLQIMRHDYPVMMTLATRLIRSRQFNIRLQKIPKSIHVDCAGGEFDDGLCRVGF